MDKTKRKRLEAAGWRFESVEDFLKLTPEEARLIELRLALSKALKEERRRRRLTQTAVAKKLNTTQPRVSRMESGDPTISFEYLFRSLFKLGATNKSLAKTIESAPASFVA